MEIIGLLCTLPIDKLKKLSDFLTIAGSEFKNVTAKNRASLITISNHLQREELQLEDMGLAQLLFFKDKITELCTEPQPPINEEHNEQDKARGNKPQKQASSVTTTTFNRKYTWGK